MKDYFWRVWKFAFFFNCKASRRSQLSKKKIFKKSSTINIFLIVYTEWFKIFFTFYYHMLNCITVFSAPTYFYQNQTIFSCYTNINFLSFCQLIFVDKIKKIKANTKSILHFNKSFWSNIDSLERGGKFLQCFVKSLRSNFFSSLVRGSKN